MRATDIGGGLPVFRCRQYSHRNAAASMTGVFQLFLASAADFTSRCTGFPGVSASRSADSRVMRASRRSPLQSSPTRSEEHTSELQSLMRISYAVFCLKKKKYKNISKISLPHIT